jgi:hypothetical protein
MLQYLIEILGTVRCPSISKITFAFLSNNISSNFDDYVNQDLLKITKYVKDEEEEIIEDFKKGSRKALTSTKKRRKPLDA